MYLGHELRKCLEQANRYICSCIGGSLETTLGGFVTPSNISRGVKPCTIFYDPFPTVEHYSLVV